MQGIEKNTVQQNNVEKKHNTPGDADSTNGSFDQAEKDIKKDPDLAPGPDPASDLDEGELARFEAGE